MLGSNVRVIVDPYNYDNIKTGEIIFVKISINS